MTIHLSKFYHTNDFETEPPLGLACLKAYLIQHGFECKTEVFHLVEAISDQIREAVQTDSLSNINNMLQTYQSKETLYYAVLHCTRKILQSKPKIVGFSLYEDDYLMSLLVAKNIKGLFPEIQILCGGPQWGDFKQAEQVLKNFDFIDAIIIGEGEIPIKQYAERVLKKTDTPVLSSILRVSNQLVINKEQRQVVMDELPFPDFSDFKAFFQNKKNTITMTLTRGCIARCSFCSEVNYWKTFRKMSPERVIEVLRHLTQTYKVNNVRFVDSLINGDIQWLEKVLTLIISHELNIRWYSMCRVDPRMNDDFISLLYRSGCQELSLGVESHSQRVLNAMRKGVLSENIEPFIRKLKKGKINVISMYIFGYPNETREDALDTINHIKRMIDECYGIIVQRFYLQRLSYLNDKLTSSFFPDNSIDDTSVPDSMYLNGGSDEDLFVKNFGNLAYYNFIEKPYLREKLRDQLAYFEKEILEPARANI